MASFIRELIRQSKTSIPCCEALSTEIMWQSQNRSIKMIDLDQTSFCQAMMITAVKQFPGFIHGDSFSSKCVHVTFLDRGMLPLFYHSLYINVDLHNVKCPRT